MSTPDTGETPRGNEETLSQWPQTDEAIHDAALKQIQNFKGKYPKQIWSLFFVEMWERFCFYGNRGMLVIFISEVLLQKIKHIPKATAAGQANLQYGAIQAFVYAFTFIGGLFADKILGFRKSLLWGGLLMIIGSFILGYNPEKFFYIGISFLVVGTGFFKPNISTMVGELYAPGDPRRDAGFSLFYSGINIGALFGGALCVWVGTEYSWHLAFALSGIFMIIGLITFLITKKSLGPIGKQPERIRKNPRARLYEILVYAGGLAVIPIILIMVTNTQYTDLFMYIVGPATLIYVVYEMRKYGKPERGKLVAALIFVIFSIFFWAFFEQSGGSLALFARDNLHSEFLGVMRLNPNVVNNSSNSFFVIILSPLVGLLWLAMAKRKVEPNAVVKFGLGFLFLALAFYTFYYCRNYVDASGKTSLNVFTLAYLIITIAELCLSPIGLSLMTKLSPKKMFGIMMGMWFLASAYGQYIAGILGADISASGTYNVVLAPANTKNPALTLSWNDTSAVKVNYKRVDVLFNTAESDTLKADWKAVKNSKINYIKLNKGGDTVAFLAANNINDGQEIFTVPTSLMARKDMHIDVQPVPTERLNAYTEGYKQLAIYALIAGLVLIAISPLVRKLMQEVK